MCFSFGGRLAFWFIVCGRDLVEKLRVLVVEVVRLRVLGLVRSSLFTVEILDWLVLGEVFAVALGFGVVGEVLALRFGLRFARGMVLFLFACIREFMEDRFSVFFSERYS